MQVFRSLGLYYIFEFRLLALPGTRLCEQRGCKLSNAGLPLRCRQFLGRPNRERKPSSGGYGERQSGEPNLPFARDIQGLASAHRFPRSRVNNEDKRPPCVHHLKVIHFGLGKIRRTAGEYQVEDIIVSCQVTDMLLPASYVGFMNRVQELHRVALNGTLRYWNPADISFPPPRMDAMYSYFMMS